jgi:hypothetical protein
VEYKQIARVSSQFSIASGQLTLYTSQQPISQRTPSSFFPHHKWVSFTSRLPVYVTFSSFCSPFSTTNLLRVRSLDVSRRPLWRWYRSRTPLPMNRNPRPLYFPRVLATGLISLQITRQPLPRRRTSSHHMNMFVIPRLGTPRHTTTNSCPSKNRIYWATG